MKNNNFWKSFIFWNNKVLYQRELIILAQYEEAVLYIEGTTSSAYTSSEYLHVLLDNHNQALKKLVDKRFALENIKIMLLGNNKADIMMSYHQEILNIKETILSNLHDQLNDKGESIQYCEQVITELLEQQSHCIQVEENEKVNKVILNKKHKMRILL